MVNLPDLPTPLGLQAKLGILGAKVVEYLVLALIVAAVAWWNWHKFVTWVREPVQQQLDVTVAANGTLVADNARLKSTNANLSKVLVARGQREGGVDARLAAIEDRLAQLQRADPEVDAWAKARIPDKVLQ